jgi:hypothetical protein
MADPLAGVRELIDEDPDLRVLSWPAQTEVRKRARPAPVAKGEVFTLRHCSIEFVRVYRTRHHGRFVWVGEFVRTWHEAEVSILARGSGDDGEHGYTADADLALAAHDDHIESTLAPLDSPRNLGPPPEPEAIPSHQVRHLPSSVGALARYEEEQIERRAAYERLPLDARLPALRRRVAERGPDAESRANAKRIRGRLRRGAAR